MQADYITFPGLTISSADFVLTHGVTPSVCVATCTATGNASSTGTLELYSKGSLIASFPDCIVDHSQTTPVKARRGQRTQVRILDRRWRWRNVRVSGTWNTPTSAGAAVASSRKTYRELITLLLQALGEKDFTITVDCAKLDGPHVQWVNSQADLELAWILDRIGAILVLGLNNKVSVVQAGSGTAPDVTTHQRTVTTDQVVSRAPEKVVVRFAPTVYQAWVPLEAVGMDLDGSVQLLNDLTYKPRTGWATDPAPAWNLAYPKSPHIRTFDYREAWNLAYRTVYKWYRIPEELTLDFADGAKVRQRSDMLPLRPQLLSTHKWTSAYSRDASVLLTAAAEPLVYGIHSQASAVANYSTLVDVPFSLDIDNGIVRFRDCIFATNYDKDIAFPTGITTPVLYLLCAFTIADDKGVSRAHEEEVMTGVPDGVGDFLVNESSRFNWQATSYSFSLPVGVAGVNNARAVQQDNNNPSGLNNLTWRNLRIRPAGDYSGTTDLAKHGQALAQATAKRFRAQQRSDVQLAGLHPIEMNGSVLQVRWSVHPGSAPETVYSLGGESSVYAPTYTERRASESLARLVGD